VLVWTAPRPATLPLKTLKASENWNWPRIRAALGELAKASLIAWPVDAEEIAVRRVLQLVTRERLSDNEKYDSLGSVVLRATITRLGPGRLAALGATCTALPYPVR
jgi:hypothetical protein